MGRLVWNRQTCVDPQTGQRRSRVNAEERQVTESVPNCGSSILQTLIDKVVIHSGAAGREIELIGEIARMVELGLEGRPTKKAALDERTACSVKVVAGVGFEPTTFRL